MVLEPDILAAGARQFRPISPSRVFYKVRELPLRLRPTLVRLPPRLRRRGGGVLVLYKRHGKEKWDEIV